MLGAAPRVQVPQVAEKPIHLLTLTPFYPTAHDDASGCFIPEPLAWLEKNGLSNSVFAVQPIYRGRMRANDSAPPAHWFSYPALPGGFGLPTSGTFLYARLLSAIRRHHQSYPLDLIHAHAPLPCGHAAALLSRELKIPYVVSVHGLDAFSTAQVKGYAGKWCERISRMVYRSARRVICVSGRVRDEVVARAGRECRTTVVYNGVDPTMFHSSFENPNSEPVILSIGNLIPIKGHRSLLHAIAGLKEKYPTLSCHIIGDGPELSRLAALSEQLGISSRVHFLGRQSRRAVAEALQQCTVFALPSRYEGLGCVYLEAMSSEKPVIGCRGQGIEEIIHHGENGCLVEPENVEELSSALSTLLENSTLRQQIGSMARRTVLERLTLSHQADRLTQIYRECLE
jgi:teichuronic acid biosynthesis glycosyltransferase TuaC